MQDPKRTEVINFLATRYNLDRYLEVGLQNPIQNFDKIVCKYKVSVDPDPNAHASFRCTSDDFFKVVLEDQYMGAGNYNLIFLDGEHSAEQLEKDFENAISILSDGGIICMHDTSPVSEELTHFPRDKSGSWNGSCYKFASRLRGTSFFTVDVDHGVSVYRKIAPITVDYETISWDYFDKNRKELLNLISWDEFIEL